ncbi:MAG: hypothetical protein DIU63_15865, partial [Proteobacteria bacterium]
LALGEALAERIRRHIRENATPRHVPARIVQVTLKSAPKSANIVQVSRIPSILTLVEAGVGAAIVPRSLERLNPHVLRFHAIDPPVGPPAQFVVARPIKGKNASALAFMAELLAKR